VLQEHIQQILGAIRSNGVVRNVNGMENCILLQDSSQLDCEFIVKKVAREIYDLEVFIDEHGVKEVASCKVLQTIFR